MLTNMLNERRANPKKHSTDFFDFVLEELGRKNTILTEAIALDLMFVLLFASFETTSLALTLATKLLVDHPLALKALTVRKRRTSLLNHPSISRVVALVDSLKLFAGRTWSYN